MSDNDYKQAVEQQYMQLCKEEMQLIVQIETVRAAKKHWEDKAKQEIQDAKKPDKEK